MRTLVILLALSLLILVPAYLEAQEEKRAPFQSTTPVSSSQLDSVGVGIDSTPRTVAALVTRTGQPEAIVRASVSRLVAAKAIRYRMVPVASGDTTATGRPRRERAYYRPAVTPQADAARPAPRPR